MAIRLRELTGEETAAIAKLTRSRTASAREVERARIILLAGKGKRAPAIAQESELTDITVRAWLKRFNADSGFAAGGEPGAGSHSRNKAQDKARLEQISQPRFIRSDVTQVNYRLMDEFSPPTRLLQPV